MSNDYQIKKPKDLTKINPNDFGELLWWSYQFGITLERLITDIQVYGVNVKDITQHLSAKKANQ